MKNDDTAYIVVGKFGSTYGIHGWIKINTFTEFGENILTYKPWYVNRNNIWTSLTIEDGRLYGNGVIVKIPGINSPEEARLFTGLTIGVTRSQLPQLEKDEYYWSDLIGLTAINQKSEILGKVIYLMETGSNDVLVVKGEKEHAIPYIMGSVIKKVDLEKKEIHVDWELV